MPEIKLTYRGPQALAGTLVSALNGHGLTVSWDPVRLRGRQASVQLDLLVTTSTESVVFDRAARNVIERFTAQFPDVTVEVTGVSS